MKGLQNYICASYACVNAAACCRFWVCLLTLLTRRTTYEHCSQNYAERPAFLVSVLCAGVMFLGLVLNDRQTTLHSSRTEYLYLEILQNSLFSRFSCVEDLNHKKLVFLINCNAFCLDVSCDSSHVIRANDSLSAFKIYSHIL